MSVDRYALERLVRWYIAHPETTRDEFVEDAQDVLNEAIASSYGRGDDLA